MNYYEPGNVLPIHQPAPPDVSLMSVHGPRRDAPWLTVPIRPALGTVDDSFGPEATSFNYYEMALGALASGGAGVGAAHVLNRSKILGGSLGAAAALLGMGAYNYTRFGTLFVQPGTQIYVGDIPTASEQGVPVDSSLSDLGTTGMGAFTTLALVGGGAWLLWWLLKDTDR